MLTLGKKTQVVRPFIEVRFGSYSYKTPVQSGSNPVWNHSIAIPFEPPFNDFSPEGLVENGVILENMHIYLFDEVTVDLLQDERERDSTIHQRKERHWLGTVTIPFSTLYEQTRVSS